MGVINAAVRDSAGDGRGPSAVAPAVAAATEGGGDDGGRIPKERRTAHQWCPLAVVTEEGVGDVGVRGYAGR